jgi:FAD/FMN-containing dehydrogenase
MDREIKKELEKVVGKEGIVSERKRQKELLGGTPSKDSFVLLPSSHEEISEILKIANSKRVPVRTTYYGRFDSKSLSDGGIFLLFSRMKKIENLDVKNLIAHVQRGVTFDELNAALKEHNQKILPPANAYTDSVVETYVMRSVQYAMNRYPDIQFSNLYAVLPSGDIYKTGSHILSEKIADWKDEPGPHICKIYHGGEDIFGIVSRGSIQTYPLMEMRKAMVFHFLEMEKAFEFLKWVSRKELVQEGVLLNAKEWTSFSSVSYFEGWVSVCGFESFKKHVEFQMRKVSEKAKEMGGVHIEDGDEMGLKYIETPGRSSLEDTVEFFSLFREIKFFDDLLKNFFLQNGIEPKDIRACYISCSTGRCLFAKYTLPLKNENLIKEAYKFLLKNGAFVDRLIDGVAEEYYSKNTLPTLIKKLKDAIDPFRILNPEKFIEV